MGDGSRVRRTASVPYFFEMLAFHPSAKCFSVLGTKWIVDHLDTSCMAISLVHMYIKGELLPRPTENELQFQANLLIDTPSLGFGQI